jgi:pimeloyl-ACP methyl ester carboxylesterase
MRVFLIHGMGRTRASLLVLERRLARAGHATSLFGYQVMQQDLPSIAADFGTHVARTLGRAAGEPYAVIGHSLGNVITRLASPGLPAGFARFVMLAPPNRSPALARAMRNSRVFHLLTGDAGKRLGDHAFFETLPVPNVPTLVIAGQSAPRFMPFRGAPSDGVVAVHETHLPGARHEVVDSAHTFIMNSKRTTELVLRFLESEVSGAPSTS